MSFICGTEQREIKPFQHCQVRSIEWNYDIILFNSFQFCHSFFHTFTHFKKSFSLFMKEKGKSRMNPLQTRNLLFMKMVILVGFVSSVRASYSRRGGHSGGMSRNDFVPFGRWSSSGAVSRRTTRLASNRNGNNEESSLNIKSWQSETASQDHQTSIKLQRPSVAIKSASTTIAKPVPKTQQRTKKRDPAKTTTPAETTTTIEDGAIKPLISESIWQRLKGNEYDDPKAVDALADSCLDMISKHQDNEWVSWDKPLPTNLNEQLADGNIFSFAGKCQDKSYFGSEISMVKSLSILPMSPRQAMELMLDSKRVPTYNKLSLGRQDLRMLDQNNDADDDDKETEEHAFSCTKIVRNTIQVPVTKKKVESVTMLHGRQLPAKDGTGVGDCLLISRAMPDGSPYYSSKEDNVGRTYILLGINLLQSTDNENECKMTAINHVYSPGVPVVMAVRVGLKSAHDFVKDIRALVTAGAAATQHYR